MFIKSIGVTNFKSFKKLKIDLGNFTVLIGENASGKSNFVELFRFARDIALSGFKNAISMQGGYEYLLNKKLGFNEPFSFEITLQSNIQIPVKSSRKRSESFFLLDSKQIIYEFSVKFRENREDYRVLKDKLTFIVDTDKASKDKIAKREKYPKEFVITKTNGKISTSPKTSDFLFFREKKDDNTLLIEDFRLPIFPSLNAVLNRISIYNLDTKMPKRAVPITGKTKLEEDGSNLAVVLKRIVEDSEKKAQLLHLVEDVLPFIKGFGVEKLGDKSLLFTLKESYFKNINIPAAFISDGTISILAIIIATYFEKDSLVLFEEPEKSVHPHLASKIVAVLKDSSIRKQIIITSHNPEVLRYAGLENTYMVSRGKDGFSNISGPVANNKRVSNWVKSGLDINDIFAQNLFE